MASAIEILMEQRQKSFDRKRNQKQQIFGLLEKMITKGLKNRQQSQLSDKIKQIMGGGGQQQQEFDVDQAGVKQHDQEFITGLGQSIQKDQQALDVLQQSNLANLPQNIIMVKKLNDRIKDNKSSMKGAIKQMRQVKVDQIKRMDTFATKGIILDSMTEQQKNVARQVKSGKATTTGPKKPVFGQESEAELNFRKLRQASLSTVEGAAGAETIEELTALIEKSGVEKRELSEKNRLDSIAVKGLTAEGMDDAQIELAEQVKSEKAKNRAAMQFNILQRKAFGIEGVGVAGTTEELFDMGFEERRRKESLTKEALVTKDLASFIKAHPGVPNIAITTNIREAITMFREHELHQESKKIREDIEKDAAKEKIADKRFFQSLQASMRGIEGTADAKTVKELLDLSAASAIDKEDEKIKLLEFKETLKEQSELRKIKSDFPEVVGVLDSTTSAEALRFVGQFKGEEATKKFKIANFKSEDSLRNEFEKLKVSQTYTKIEIAFNQIEGLVELDRFLPVGASREVLDQALVTYINKMTDPDSVVRESEFDRFFKFGSVEQALKAFVARKVRGGAVSKAQRESILRTAFQIQNGIKELMKEKAARFDSIISNRGLDRNSVFSFDFLINNVPPQVDQGTQGSSGTLPGGSSFSFRRL